MTLKVIDRFRFEKSDNDYHKIKITKEKVKLEEIKPNFSVNRDLDASKVKEIKEKIQKTGRIKPLFIDDKGLIDGHHRYAALLELRIDTVPVFYYEGDFSELPDKLQKKVAKKYHINRESLNTANRRG